MPSRGRNEHLHRAVQARDYRAIEKTFAAAGTAVTDEDLDDVVKALMDVEFGRFTLTAGWWPLVKRLLPRSQRLREHVFVILGGGASATAADAYRTTDRSNLLHAIARLHLTPDELALLRRLRDRIEPVYREDVDAVLLEHATEEEQVDFLKQIWDNAAGRAAGKPASPPPPAAPIARPARVVAEERWLRRPFRLLACMPFSVPEVSRAWEGWLRSALEAMGDVLRLDWSTDDWVRDIRRLVEQASFVVIDLTGANVNVRRELAYLLRKDIPCLCYAAGRSGASTVGQIHSMLAADAERVDPEVWGMPVYTADYANPADLDRLASVLDERIRPFCDREDPTVAYTGRDMAALAAIERRGLELARVPRARTSAERLWKEGKDLVSESAIFRARVFSWLADPHLQIHYAENLWLREHLLMLVREGVQRGHRLTEAESRALQTCVAAETAEPVRDLGEDVLAAARRALAPSPAELRGLPPPPPELPEDVQTASPSASLKIERTAGGEPAGLRASAWPATFGASAASLRRAMAGKSGVLSGRIFALEARGWDLGEVEDALDALAGSLGTMTIDMVRSRWSNSEIEIFLQATVSLATLRELRRRGLFEAGKGKQEHERLAQELAYIWRRPASELQLFEFAAGSRPVHFRGLFPWIDVKEQAVRVHAAEAFHVVRGTITEAEIVERTMAWDYIPGQLWDAILGTRMPEVAPPAVMRDLWARYVLPSAFLYWRRDSIYTDPADTRLWVYVLTNPPIAGA